MPPSGLLSPISFYYGCSAICIVLLINLGQGVTVNQVSIEDFIDLDADPSNTPGTHLVQPLSNQPDKQTYKITHNINSDNKDVNVLIHNNKNNNNDDNDDVGDNKEDSVYRGVGYLSADDPSNDVIVDDEDLLSSGSGSGSGDFLLASIDNQDGAGLVLTETSRNRRLGQTVDMVIADGEEESQGKTDANNQIELQDFLTDDNKNIFIGKGPDGSYNKQDNNNNNNNVIDTNKTFTLSSSSEPNEEKGDDNENSGIIDLNQTADDIDYETIYDDISDVDNFGTDRLFEKDADEMWDLMKKMQSDQAEKGKRWTSWHHVGQRLKVRVEECSADEDSRCENGVRIQLKSCTRYNGQCGQVHETSTDLSATCGSFCHRSNDSTPSPLSLSPNPSPTPSPTPTTPPTPHGCEYSLYDTTRRKYVFLRWDLSKVVTESKVKRWCKKDNNQFLVMTTPTDVCRKYLHDLCKASQKCKNNKPPRERGDFAEGCWRGLVFGDMLPVGLSQKQTIIYFICQRFSSASKMGHTFGYKQTHFGTLYDPKLRAPVLSLHKMEQVGDETWPESDHFIEHGLIEQKKDVMWLFSRHRKGMVTLKDLDRCYRDQACDLGRFQVLPQDYSRESGNTQYMPVPLVWPEWMSVDPDARTATLALTNTVPLHNSLHQEWTSAVRKIRTFSIEECGVPYVTDPSISQVGQLSSHRSNKSALYIASGAIPSTDTALKTGRGVPVPSHLWIAGCCVQKLVRGEDMYKNDVLIDSDDENKFLDTKITSFSLLVKNLPGSHVTTASIFRLEMLLQNFYRVKDKEPDVSLFPGQKNACSDLRNDVSEWFQFDRQ